MGRISATASSAFAAGGRNRLRTLLLFGVVAVLYYISLNLNTSELLGSTLPHSPITSIDLDPDAPSVLLVSAYFPSTSASSTSELKRLLSSTHTPLYIYTPPAEAPLLKRLRGALPLTLNTTFTTPFDVPHLRGLEPALEAQTRLGRAQDWHTPALYALLAAKPYFLAEAAAHAAPDFAFWVDPAVATALPASAARWPDPYRVREAFEIGTHASGKPPESLYLLATWKPLHGNFKWWNDGLGPIVADFVDPSFFGGAAPALPTLAASFAAHHALYLRDELFVGLDQPLLNTLAVTYAQHAVALPGPCYAYALMSPDARAAAARWTWVWSVMAGRPRCDDVKAVSLVEVLRERFGKGWTPPRSIMEA